MIHDIEKRDIEKRKTGGFGNEIYRRILAAQ